MWSNKDELWYFNSAVMLQEHYSMYGSWHEFQNKMAVISMCVIIIISPKLKQSKCGKETVKNKTSRDAKRSLDLVLTQVRYLDS